MDQKNKNFIILFINLAIISYMVGGLPKFFSVLAPKFSQLFNINKPTFDNYLYNSTFFSLSGKLIFSFLINSKNFEKIIPLTNLFIIIIFCHSLSLIFCLIPSLNFHIIGRYNQGLWAGILLILLEPIIFNCSEKASRKKLLYLKYEMVALLTPMAFLITNLTETYWSWVLILMASFSLIASIAILFCKSQDNYYIENQNNLLSIGGFFESLTNPIIFLNNLIIGGILGCFLVLCQNHYLHVVTGKPLVKGIIQGLPYSLGFLISFFIKNDNIRNIIRKIVVYILMASCFYLMVGFYGQWNLKYGFMALINGLYIVFLLWTPDILNKLLHIKPENISHRSVSTASQVIRSLMTLIVCKVLNIIYQNKKEIHGFYLMALLVFIGINGLLMTFNINEKNVYYCNIIYGIVFGILIISVYC